MSELLHDSCGKTNTPHIKLFKRKPGQMVKWPDLTCDTCVASSRKRFISSSPYTTFMAEPLKTERFSSFITLTFKWAHQETKNMIRRWYSQTQQMGRYVELGKWRKKERKSKLEEYIWVSCSSRRSALNVFHIERKKKREKFLVILMHKGNRTWSNDHPNILH